MLDLDQLAQCMPNLHCWRKNLDLIYSDFNRKITKNLGLKDKNAAIGLNDYEIPCFADVANSFQIEDKQVLAARKIHEYLTIVNYPKCGWAIFLVTKVPWYDSNHNLAGILGYGQDLSNLLMNHFDLFKGLIFDKKIIPSSFILDKNFSKKTNVEINLTPRESECLFLLIRGNTIKTIGKILQLSPRTIEHYVEQLRYKFTTTTKAELISKSIDQGFLNYIPKKLLTRFS